MENDSVNLIPSHGGYRNLKSYQTTTLIYDLTVEFCNSYMTYKTNGTNKSYRTYDQMVQAARSGRQNIAEGCQASGTSKKTELKLIGVARASLEELLLDYEDFLRQNSLPLWGKDDRRVREIRELAYETHRTNETYRFYLGDPENFANCLICLIHQANFLLDRQLKALEKSFLEEGGFTERLYKARKRKIGPILFLIAILGSMIVTPPARAAAVINKLPSSLGLATNLVGHWTMDGKDINWTANTMTDKSGNGNTGTITNMSTTTSPTIGKLGQGLRFDGVNDKVTLNSISGSQTFTISSWVYFRGLAIGNRYGAIVNNSSSGQGFLIRTNVQLFLNYYDGSGEYTTSLESDPTTANEKWYHLAVTCSSGSCQYYANGAPLGTAFTITGSQSFNEIGGDTGNGYLMNWILDEVRIYNRALSVPEIKRLYNQGASKFNASPTTKLTSGLVGYWTMDGKDINWTANTMTDKSGNGNTGTITNMSTTTSPTIGKIGQGLKFDGVDAHIALSSPSALDDIETQGGGGMTISAWINAASYGDSTVGSIVGTTSGSSGNWRLYLDGANTRVRFSKDYDTTDLSCVTTAGFFPSSYFNSWRHIVLTWDGGSAYSGCKIYINATDSSGTGIDGATTKNLDAALNKFIGGLGTGNSFNGQIDEVRIYNRALSAQEIKTLYNQGASKFNASPTSKLTSGLVGYWTMDGKDINWSANTMTDKSGNANTGAITNMSTTTSPVIGKLGQALKFDGVNDYVQIYTTGGAPSGLIFQTAPFSVSFWIKSPNNSDWHSDFLISSRRNYGYTFQHRSDGSLRWLLNDAGGIDYIDASGVLDDTWHHVVGLRDGTNVRMYVDSVEKTPVTDNGRDVYDESTPPALRFGVDGASIPASFHGGLIDDVRIYNRALSQSEIKQLYNMGR